MWGIPAQDWGSREFSALASRINDCENLYLQARERNQSRKGNQCGGLAGYVRRQFEQPRKDAEERDRQAQVTSELERQNRAALERHKAAEEKATAEEAKKKADQEAEL